MSRKKTAISILLLIFLFSNFTAFAQTDRGAGNIKIKKANGKTEEIKLYNASYALVIGNGNYTNGWDNLPGVRSDVAAVKGVLEKQGFVVETAENLSSRDFTNRIQTFIDDYGYEANNRLLVYYAGHGHTLKSTGDGRDLGYVVPTDSPLPAKDEIGFKRRAIPMDDIQNYAKKIQSKHALFIFDSCFSGRLVTRNAIVVPPIIQESVAYPVRQFITAGAANQPVPDESIFRRAFVRALEGEADRNADGYVTGTELAEYLKEKVTNYSNRRQTPQYGKINDVELDRGDFVFVQPSASANSSTAENTAPPVTAKPVTNNTANTPADAWARFRETAQTMLKYDFASSFAEDLAVVKIGTKYGYIDKSGREIIALKYGDAGVFSEGLAPVQIGGKWGFIDKTGREIIAPKYDSGKSFSDGLALVQIGGTFGFIDTSGREVIAFKYDSANSFADGLAPVEIGGKYGYIDTSGREIIAPKYDFAGPFSDGLATVEISNKRGYIDKSGREIIAPKYYIAFLFSDGLAGVKIGDKWGFIDKSGREVIPVKYDMYWCLIFIKEGFIGVKLNGKKGFVDLYGNEYFDF